MDMDFIRKRITELRLAKGVSELAMSQALGHGRAYITHITSGRANPSVPELLYIIEYLDVTPRTFFSEGNENDSLLLQKLVESAYYDNGLGVKHVWTFVGVWQL